MSASIKVFAPATVANLACGFDAIGLAIHGPGDEIVARIVPQPGIHIEEITGAKGKLSTDPLKNTATIAAAALLKALGDTTTGFAFKLHKKMPIGSGLGSSAASAAAGAYVVNMLLKQPFEKRHLLPFALEGEAFASGAKHADNVAPALLGGIQLIRDNATLDLHRIYSPKGLHVVVVYPEIEMLTKDARNLLSPNVTLKQHVSQSANLAALIVGLTNTDFDLIGRSLRDQIIEPQRAVLIPHFYDVQAAAMTAGALGCSISGAGPSIFAMCKNTLEAENISAAMSAVFTQQKIKHQCFISDINHDGAVLV